MNFTARQVIDSPAAWVNAPKERFLRQLSDLEIDAFADAVKRTAATPVLDVTADAFGDDTLRTLAADVRIALRSGAGAICLSGLANRFDEQECARVYMGLGTLLGRRVIQNYRGDVLTRVEKEEDPDNPYDSRTKGRGYRNADEAGYHTDTNEIVGLMCVRRAESGGASVITSAVAIHNDFVRHHPDLLASLFEGYYQAIGEDEVMTEAKSPVFGDVDGHLSVYFQVRAMRLAATKRGETLPPDLDRALAYFYERASANEAEFVLEDGEILFWNNRTQLHGRRSFENSPARRRLLYRLWLEPADPLPIPATFAEHTKQRLREAEAAAA